MEKWRTRTLNDKNDNNDNKMNVVRHNPKDGYFTSETTREILLDYVFLEWNV